MGRWLLASECRPMPQVPAIHTSGVAGAGYPIRFVEGIPTMPVTGTNVKRFERLLRYIELRWGDRDPGLVERLNRLLRIRYLVEFGDAGVEEDADPGAPV